MRIQRWAQRFAAPRCLGSNAAVALTMLAILLPLPNACSQDDNAYPNIAYHLAILAMEEIGKAGMLASRAVIGAALEGERLQKRLDDHVYKLMWAVWSPSMSGGKIDPKDFEQARQFAESTHARRKAGLYVDYSEDDTLVAPAKPCS